MNRNTGFPLKYTRYKSMIHINKVPHEHGTHKNTDDDVTIFWHVAEQELAVITVNRRLLITTWSVCWLPLLHAGIKAVGKKFIIGTPACVNYHKANRVCLYIYIHTCIREESDMPMAWDAGIMELVSRDDNRAKIPIRKCIYNIQQTILQQLGNVEC